jgi:hypothetical protein
MELSAKTLQKMASIQKEAHELTETTRHLRREGKETQLFLLRPELY